MIIALIFALFFVTPLCSQTTIILDPSGDSSTPGRQLHESYERAQTYDFAQELKKVLELSFNFRVILTRAPGQTLEPFQAITLANQQGNFLVRLHFFKDPREQPQLYGFRLFFDPVFDVAPHTLDPQSFIHIHQAHFMSSTTTTFLCNKIRHELTSEVNQKLFDFYGFYGIPVKPLVGCTIPAILFDIGINSDTAWRQLISPVAAAITSSFI